MPHLAAAVTGPTALLRASGVAFEAVEIFGVCSWRGRPGGTRAPWSCRRSWHRGRRLRVITSAVLVNLLNPKLTIFFYAFLPPLVAARSAHQPPTTLTLSGVFMAVTFVVFAAGLRGTSSPDPMSFNRVRQCFAASFVALGSSPRPPAGRHPPCNPQLRGDDQGGT